MAQGRTNIRTTTAILGVGLCDDFKHTRGRWEGTTVFAENAPTETHIVTGEWGGGRIARVFDAPMEVITKANADLIAAAPEMLAALCDWYDNSSSAGHEAGVSIPYDTLMQQTEKAIGKAKDWE